MSTKTNIGSPKAEGTAVPSSSPPAATSRRSSSSRSSISHNNKIIPAEKNEDVLDHKNRSQDIPVGTTTGGNGSICVAVLVALLAFALGLWTPLRSVPPFRNHIQHASPASTTTMATTAATSGSNDNNDNDHIGDTIPPRPEGARENHESTRDGDGDDDDYVDEDPLYPCTDERLEQFLHESYVPGFHILCWDMDDANLSLQYYRGGATTIMSPRISLPVPLSWSTLRDWLVTSLRLPPASDADMHHQAWALFTPEGERIVDAETLEDDVGEIAITLAAQFEMVLLYQGGQFLWPGVRIGFERSVALYSIMPPHSPHLSDDTKNVRVTLETLSLVPLVLSVRGFLSTEECQHIQQRAAPTMEYSGVVLMDHDQGRPASDFRTSQTTFLDAEDDEILLDLDYRTASLVRLPRTHQETVQVLRYGSTERYVSHHDYFDPSQYQQDQSTLQLIDNGRRNRMVTVFWYLSDVEEGGETVFPRFNRGREQSFEDCETGLKVKPELGKVIIFYNMMFDGTTDPNSLHGACPVKKGVKWAANKWVWNEPMEYVSP